jgi:DNA polymerase-3 subunit alpha
VDLIQQTTGERIDPYAFPLEDEATFALLCRGETKGIFQLESGGIRDLLQRMKPDHFRDTPPTPCTGQGRSKGAWSTTTSR